MFFAVNTADVVQLTYTVYCRKWSPCIDSNSFDYGNSKYVYGCHRNKASSKGDPN